MKTVFIVLASLCLALGVQAQDQPTQTVRGTVIDKMVQTPLLGATVFITTLSSPKGVTTDEQGRFKITEVPIGRHEVKVVYMGYKTVTLPNVLVTSGKEVVLTISLEEEILQSEEVLIVVERDKSKANNTLVDQSVVNLRTEEINRFAGSRQDPSRMASNYAGVVGGGDQRNDIIVRGNSPAGVLWRFEGVDIPNPNHFTYLGTSGGVFSILNNNLLSNSDFMTGAFPAEYGNKTAAVFDVKMREGNNEKRENTFQVGLNGIEYATEGPISKKAGSSYLASYRLLTFEGLNKLGVNMGVNGIPQFQDVNFKLNLPTSKMGTFSIWGLGGKSSINIRDKIDPVSVKDTMTYEEDKFSSDMFALGVSNVHKISSKTTGKAIFSTSGSQIRVNSFNEFPSSPTVENFVLKNIEGQHIVNYTLSTKVNARNLFKMGVISRNVFYNNYSREWNYEERRNYEILNQKGGSYLHQAFVHWQHKPTEKLTINTGLYSQWFMLNNKKVLEPRASVSYAVNERQKVSFAAGMHSQTQSLFIYQYRFLDTLSGAYSQPNTKVGFTKSVHLVGGYQYMLTKQLRFKAEGYYQHMYNVPVSVAATSGAGQYSILNTGADFGFYAFDKTVNTGLGRNYGVEITLERYLNKGYYFLTNTSLLKSTYKGSDGIERSTAFDIGHVFNVLAGKEFKIGTEGRKSISVDGKFNHSGGRRIMPIDVEASKKEDREKYDFDRIFEEKLKDYVRFDMKISYNVNNKKATHQLYVAADNVLNTKNEMFKSWDRKKQEVVTVYQLGLFPYLGYRVQF